MEATWFDMAKQFLTNGRTDGRTDGGSQPDELPNSLSTPFVRSRYVGRSAVR